MATKKKQEVEVQSVTTVVEDGDSSVATSNPVDVNVPVDLIH